MSEPADIAAERSMEAEQARHPSRDDRQQRRANNSGLTLIELESSWWGNEKLGSWESKWWARIDVETEDAIHLSAATDDFSRAMGILPNTDVWLPKSKLTRLAEPEWETHEPDGEKRGTLTLQSPTSTRYGPKHEITGDTYDAFKQDGLDDALPWDQTHATFNGDAWEIDANDDARAILRSAALDAGYALKTLA